MSIYRASQREIAKTIDQQSDVEIGSRFDPFPGNGRRAANEPKTEQNAQLHGGMVNVLRRPMSAKPDIKSMILRCFLSQ